MDERKVVTDAMRDEANALLASSDVVADAATVDAIYDRMAQAITACYGETCVHVLAVMSGGLFPAAELLKRLHMPLTLDYLHATRYRGETSGRDLVWKVAPPGDLMGRDVLLVDDILDEGYTLREICGALRDNGVASLRVAVLADKRHERRVGGANADFIGIEVPDQYVFGCGMDVRGYWRQLPEIRALRDSA